MTSTSHALLQAVGLCWCVWNSVSSFSSSSFSEYTYDVPGIVGPGTCTNWCGGWELYWGAIGVEQWM